VLTVVSVQASATGMVWVLERASDGARATLHFSGHVAQGAALSIGGAVMVTALTSGYVLSAAGNAIAFIPNEMGRALLHNERITR
jgi:F0F1-type ATP synthase membrane subunit c/vacuolar-type H+-ATPase subunit K